MGYFPGNSVAWRDGGKPRLTGMGATTPAQPVNPYSTPSPFFKPANTYTPKAFDWQNPFGGTKNQPTTIAGKLRILDTGMVPIIGPILQAAGVKVPGLFHIIETLSSNGGKQKRFNQFNAALEAARKAAESAVRVSLPKADAILKDFANQAKLVEKLVKDSEGTESEQVAYSLEALASAFAEADSLLQPVTDLAQEINDQTEVYAATADAINPWDVGGPGVTALDRVSKAATKLNAATAQAGSSMQRLKRAVSTAQATVKKDKADRDAAQAAQKRAQAIEAQSVVRDAIVSANEFARTGDFETALGIVQDPAIIAAAKVGNMVAQLQAAINAYGRQRDENRQKAQANDFFAFLSQVRDARAAQYPAYQPQPVYAPPAGIQPTTTPGPVAAVAPTQYPSYPVYPTGSPSVYEGEGVFGMSGSREWQQLREHSVGIQGMGDVDVSGIIASARLALSSRVDQVKKALEPVLGPEAVQAPPEEGIDVSTVLLGVSAAVLAGVAFKRWRS